VFKEPSLSEETSRPFYEKGSFLRRTNQDFLFI